MNRLVFGFAALLAAAPLVFAAGAAPAGTNLPPLSHFSLGAHLSYWNVDTLDEFDIDGSIGGGVIGHFRLHDFFALEMRLSGFATGYSEDKFTPDEGWYKNEFTVVSLPMEAGVVGILPLGGAFSLYGGPGVGYYLFDGQYRSEYGPRTTIYDIEIDDEGGWFVLLGARVQAARNLAFYLEGKYTWIETSVEQVVDTLHEIGIDWIKQDWDFSGLAINAGMMFTF